MKKISKALIISAGILALSTSASAYETKLAGSDVGLKLSAFAHFQAALRNQTKLGKPDASGTVDKYERNVSRHRKNFAFYNETALTAEIYKELDEVKYGAKIVLVPTSKRKGGIAYNGSHIYVESDFGRMEMGAPISPAIKMMESGASISAASGNWGNYANLETTYMKQGVKSGIDFATSPDFFLGDKLGTSQENRSYSSEPPRSIAYYTPKFELTDSTKVQIGAAYTPDSSNTAADKVIKPSDQFQKKEVSGLLDGMFVDYIQIDRTVKNAVSGGVTIEQNFADGVDLKLAFTGEYGRAAGKLKYFDAADNELHSSKLKDLRSYNIGGVLTLGNFSVAGSYGSLGKSLTSKKYHRNGQKTDYYTAAVAYKQGPFAASVNYFKSNQFKNTVDAITLGTNYQLAPGFKPYAEITSYVAKGKPEFNNSSMGKRTTRGTVALIGAKLSL